MIELHNADCLVHMATMEANSVDAIVSDPPYGLSFMGKDWDHGVPGKHFWEEALRVAKPGAYILAFGGTRTFHRLAVAIEDAGWEIRDTLMWVYGSGFPKSHNVAIGIDKANGAPPRGKALVVAGRGEREDLQGSDANPRPQELEPYTPATEAAKQWYGWGTALKPAWEPIIMARKPLVGTVAQNVQAHGTGAINVDGCRVGTNGEKLQSSTTVVPKYGDHGDGRGGSTAMLPSSTISHPSEQHTNGRWPANLIHDGSDEVVKHFPESDPATASARGGTNPNPMDWGNARPDSGVVKGHDDNGGSAARFFYCAKASKADRDEGLEGFAEKQQEELAAQAETLMRVRENGTIGVNPYLGNTAPKRNVHPTVKPTALMRYLCKLVTPPGGTVFDPFMGSGSTGKAAVLEGFSFVGCDLQAEYLAIARARCEWATEEHFRENAQQTLFRPEPPRLFDAPRAPEATQLTIDE